MAHRRALAEATALLGIASRAGCLQRRNAESGKLLALSRRDASVCSARVNGPSLSARYDLNLDICVGTGLTSKWAESRPSASVGRAERPDVGGTSGPTGLSGDDGGRPKSIRRGLVSASVKGSWLNTKSRGRKQ